MNLSRSAQAVELDMTPFTGRIPVEMLGRTPFPSIGTGSYTITLQAYGFFWFELTTQAQKYYESLRDITLPDHDVQVGRNRGLAKDNPSEPFPIPEPLSMKFS